MALNIKDWNKWLYGIEDISNFSFRRCIIQDNSYKGTEMQTFSDSSREANAVTCFGRFVHNDNTVSVRFLFRKCKVCPMSRSLTIPHLELVVAALATRIACSVLQERDIKYEHAIYWSDSCATL